MTQSEAETNHYAILNLPSPPDISNPPTAHDIKQAYRLALLSYHPDKTKSPSNPPEDPLALQNDYPKPSIDAIKRAYEILSSPRTRQTYDRTLLLQTSRLTSPSQQQRSFHPGSEILDLDDLTFDEQSRVWYLACRCGENKGFIVREDDLEREEQKGGREVVVGCVGCSLWIRVGFGVVDDGEHNGTEVKHMAGMGA